MSIIKISNDPDKGGVTFGSTHASKELVTGYDVTLKLMRFALSQEIKV